MKTRFLLFTLLFGSAASAQVLVQPVTGVHTIRVEDNVTLKVYAGDKTQLEVSNNLAVAQISNGVMSMDGNTSAVLRLNPADRIISFTAEDHASILFSGPFDFGDEQLVITTEDNAKVEFNETLAGTLNAGYVILKAQDNSRIHSELPLSVNAYNFEVVDNACIEVPAVDRKPAKDSTVDRSAQLTVLDNGKLVIGEEVIRATSLPFHFKRVKNKASLTDNGKIVIKDKGTAGIISCEHGFSIGGRKSKKPHRDFEANWSWGFNNWGDTPFGNIDGDAEVTYSFLNVGFSLDYPLVNTPHFGLYAGLGVEVNRYHFREHLVCATPTGFQQPSAMYPAYATITTGTPDPNNWDSYFFTAAIVVPITFSFEPWKYDDFCIRLTALPGINVNGYLSQEYESKSTKLTVRDKDVSKRLNPFVLDARLALFYSSIGVYVQMSTQKLFKSDFQDIYPVKFGLIWSIGGR